jgi:hypothetical protein
VDVLACRPNRLENGAVAALLGGTLTALLGLILGASTWHEILAWTLVGVFLVGALILGAGLILVRGRNLVAEAHSLNDIRALPSDQFEELVAQVFRMKGWTAATTQREGDGGADVILTHGRRRALVQCKSWRTFVGVDDIRALYGVMSKEHVTAGILRHHE